jgi:myxalamid-type polyketide synthase MxaC
MKQILDKFADLPPLQKAFLAIEEMEAKLRAVERSQTEPIAVIGIGCRFPGKANDPETFWKLLQNGLDAIREVPPERYDVNTFYDPRPGTPGKMYVRHGAFLEDIDQFDAQFFGISPREAACLDPHQRLLLEVSWEALENSGYAPASLKNSRTGLFIGLCLNEYIQLLRNSGDAAAQQIYAGTGNGLSFASGRLSYVLGLQGPCVALDTACSSSLVTLHLACQSLRAKESNLALAGGVQLLLLPETTIMLCDSSALAPDGRCKTFDASANGYVRGEGCGMVVLKRLSDALADGDAILGLIRGSAVNHGGPSSGLTVPNGLAQQEVVRQALENARVQPAEISYVEAHGTGTALGDPIELRALGAVLNQGREQPLIVGSVKTNIGHLEAAAGIAGFIKVVLALRHEEIPPHLHFQEPNPQVPWAELNMKVPVRPIAWPRGNRARLASVSSFGIAGTNAHLVLEEAPPTPPRTVSSERPLHLLALSANDDAALRQLALRYSNAFTETPALDPRDVGFTANAGRSHSPHRLSIIGSTLVEWRDSLAAFANGGTKSRVIHSHTPATRKTKLAFLFTGQGAQYPGMGRDLYETQPVFRQALDQCAEIVRPHLERPLLEAIYPASGTIPCLDETAYTQPALFSLEYALAELWRSWGIEPELVLGHSVGEYVAACVAGVFSLADGLKLIAARGRLMQALPRNGLMAAVLASETRVSAAIKPYGAAVSLASLNGPNNCVISGERNAVQSSVDAFEREGVQTIKLNVSHAFHSWQMEPMLADFQRIASTIAFSAPELALISNVSGQLAGKEISTAEYWVKHVREPVRFAAGMATLVHQGAEQFLEIGPKPVLLGMARACVPDRPGAWLPSLCPGKSDWRQMLESLAELYVRGRSVDWSGFDRPYLRRRVALPTYPFQRQRYWIDAKARPSRSRDPAPLEQGQLHPLLGLQWRSPLLKDSVFETVFSTGSLPFLGDHRIYEKVVVPGACHISMLLAAGELTFGAEDCRLEEVLFQEALVIPDNAKVMVQLVITREAESAATFKLISPAGNQAVKRDSFSVHASGKILARTTAESLSENWVLGSTGYQPVPSGDSPDGMASASPANLDARLPATTSAIPFGGSPTGAGESPAPPTSQTGSKDASRRFDRVDLQALQARCARPMNRESFYQGLRQRQVQLGTAFQWIGSIGQGEREALGQMKLPRTVSDWADYQMHPGLIDSCFQLLGAAVSHHTDETYIPFSLESFRFYQRPSDIELWCHARLRQTEKSRPNLVIGDIVLFDQSGQIIAEARGLEVRKTESKALLRSLEKKPDWLYEVVWRPKAFVPVSHPEGTTGDWLILAHRGKMAEELAALLQEHGDRSVLVSPGPSYAEDGMDRYRVNPGQPEDFSKLLRDCERDGRRWKGVAYLWSALEGTEKELTLPALQEAQTLGCAGILHLVQALIQQEFSTWPRLHLVTRGAQPVVPGRLRLEQAPVWGLGRVISQEHPGLRSACIDLNSSSFEGEARALADELLCPTGEDQIAFRRGNRYVARLTRKTADRERPFSVGSNHTYLITGGLGALGLKIAEWLTRCGARHLVLTGRRQPSAESLECIRQLEQSGARVLVHQSDVSRPNEAAALFDAIASSLPPLRGLIHAAGILEDAPLMNQSQGSFARVMAPKLEGAWQLHLQTREMPLDFFVCFSSIASVLGSPGQANYGAANAFMDALAHHRRALGQAALSVNWGPWGEIGMAAKLKDQVRDRRAAQGIGLIGPEEGLEWLGALIQQGATQASVLPIQWTQFLTASLPGRDSPFLEGFFHEIGQSAGKPSVFLKQLKETSMDQRRAMLTQHVSGLIAQILGLNQAKAIDPDQGFSEMGMDSMMSVELRNLIEASLECSAPATLIFKYPTLQSLIEYLVNEAGLGLFSKAKQDLLRDSEPQSAHDSLNDLSTEEIAELLKVELANSGEKIPS